MNVLPLPIFQSSVPSSIQPSFLSVAQTAPLSLHNLIGGVARWFSHGSVNAVLPMQRTSLRQIQIPRKEDTHTSLKAESALKLVATCTQNTRPSRPFNKNVVRVVQVREPGQARSCVGRMVMSGRMADVCAELDRLVAREAAPH